MDKHFVIDQVSWHTSTPGNPESRAHIVQRFFSVVSFLQRHGLVVRKLAETERDITDSFAINSADLTDTGIAVMAASYDKWLQRLDKGLDPADVALLERSLAKVTG